MFCFFGAQVRLTTDAIAAYVWLDTSDDRRGRFSDNAFLMSTAERRLTFTAEDDVVDVEAFRRRLRVTHLAQIVVDL